ncbi:chromate transporter [Duganella sp. HH101]|uniref:chromate transporter n=1 Tax=Duganella sp. HH101 TaxID=1781066 RepID=UPI0008751814|nr:chromate transporter [Duganella sp. HH101]OEZ99736.1 chromate transport protein [Duganella sp. HH101]
MPLSTIFLVFSRLALMGFGGVMPFAYRALVEQRKWLTAEEFAQYLATSQMLPGPTICNVALMVGSRYAGMRGALAALAGMIAGPFLVVVALGVVYQRFGEIEVFRHAIRGMAAVAAGLILATAVKMAKSLFAKADWRARGTLLQLALLALAFTGLGLMQWQLALVFGLLAPLGAGAFYLVGEKK